LIWGERKRKRMRKICRQTRHAASSSDFMDVLYFPLREVALCSPFILRVYRWYVLDVWHVKPRPLEIIL
jgi:hypothetical protein